MGQLVPDHLADLPHDLDAVHIGDEPVDDVTLNSSSPCSTAYRVRITASLPEIVPPAASRSWTAWC